MQVVGYFDLFSRHRSTVAEATSGSTETPPSVLWQVALYLALLLGIYAKGYLVDSGTPPSNGRFLAAIIAAVVAFPGAYRSAMESAGPGLVQLCVVFTSGIGVKTLVDAPATDG